MRKLLVIPFAVALTFVGFTAAAARPSSGPVACFKAHGWTIRPGSTNHGGEARLPAPFTYAGWLNIGHTPGPFMWDTSGNLTPAELHTVKTCAPGVPVPDVAP